MALHSHGLYFHSVLCDFVTGSVLFTITFRGVGQSPPSDLHEHGYPLAQLMLRAPLMVSQWFCLRYVEFICAQKRARRERQQDSRRAAGAGTGAKVHPGGDAATADAEGVAATGASSTVLSSTAVDGAVTSGEYATTTQSTVEDA